MRVILDECLPRQLGQEIVGHEVTTVPKVGWSGVLNGKLLALIQDKFDAFVTIDKNLVNQQKIAGLSFGVVILRAASNDITDLKPLVPGILAALAEIKSAQVLIVGAS